MLTKRFRIRVCLFHFAFFVIEFVNNSQRPKFHYLTIFKTVLGIFMADMFRTIDCNYTLGLQKYYVYAAPRVLSVQRISRA